MRQSRNRPHRKRLCPVCRRHSTSLDTCAGCRTAAARSNATYTNNAACTSRLIPPDAPEGREFLELHEDRMVMHAIRIQAELKRLEKAEVHGPRHRKSRARKEVRR